MSKKLTPQKTAINLEIEDIAETYYKDESNESKKRGKAFQFLCYSLITKTDYEDLDDESIVDGQDEEGIDILHIEELPNELEVSIISCKSSSVDNYAGNDLTKLKNGLSYVFEENRDTVSALQNAKLKNRIFQLRDNKKKVSDIGIYYCVFNGSTPSPNVVRNYKDIEKRLLKILSDQYPNSKLSLRLLSGEDLYNIRLRNRESLRDKEITIPYYDKDRKVKAELITKEGIKGYLTTLDAREIAKLVLQYGDSLFEKNIRGWLKYNQKNTEIYESCIDVNSNLFWFLNNGITIIGDSVFADNDLEIWNIENLQIVNGQQTARMLAEAYRNKLLREDVKVMCRIYESSDYKFISKITKATNSQSSISGRDLMSNDSLQLAIQDSFGEYKVFYERQRGEVNENSYPKISAKRLAQVSLAVLCKRPSLARKNLEDNFFNLNKFYKEIFNQNPKDLLLAYAIYEYCYRSRDENKPLQYFGALHIAALIYKLNKTELMKQRETIIEAFLNKKLNFVSLYKRAVATLEKLIPKQVIEENSIGYYLSRIEVDDLLDVVPSQ
jgi:hypothetical protein